MKKTIVCVMGICMVLMTAMMGVSYKSQLEREARIDDAIARAVENNIEVSRFDEEINIPEQTYLISEKELAIPVLLYHEFYEQEPPKELYGLISTPDKFEQDVRYMLEEGYTFISMHRLIAYRDGLKGIPEKSVVLTFDDGYESNYTMIYPILKKYHIPAAIFVIEDKVGTARYFDWDAAKTMHDAGLVSIYSHGHSHVDMTQLDVEVFRDKTANNLNLMEERLGDDAHTVYSYPLGFYNDETNDVLQELGVTFYMTTNLGLNTQKQLEQGGLHRAYVAHNFDNAKLKEILTGK